MDTQLKCGACGNVIPDEEVPHAIRIRQVYIAICEECKMAIPRKGRLPLEGSSMSGRTSMYQNVIEVHITMRDAAKKYGFELCEVRLKVRKSILEEIWPKINFNGHEA